MISFLTIDNSVVYHLTSIYDNHPNSFLSFNFTTRWSENILCTISNFWNVSQFVLWLSMCPVLDDVPDVLEKNVHRAIRWERFYSCLVSSSIIRVPCLFTDLLPSFLIHYWQWRTEIFITAELSISPLDSISICFLNFGYVCLMIVTYF